MKTLNDFKKEFKLITSDNYYDALDAWFESVGQLYVRYVPISSKFEYKPAKPIISFDRTNNLNEDSYFHEMFDNAPDVLLLEISEFLFRYLKLFKNNN
jgi:hypothetical protein